MFKKAVYKRMFNVDFKISFPVKAGYVETKSITARVNASCKKDAKIKLLKNAKAQLKITVIDIKDLG